jgi:hypothetical protein
MKSDVGTTRLWMSSAWSKSQSELVNAATSPL